MKQKLNVAGIILIVLFISALAISGIDSSEELSDSKETTDTLQRVASSVNQTVKVPDIKENYTFAGERIPVNDYDVKERLQKELVINTYYHSSTVLNLLRTTRYFDKIESILIEEGVPTDFKFLAVAESNLENVTSPAGASGFWQFMPTVARHYGLEVNSAIDERYHFEKSTRAACSLIKDYYDRFGSWTLAAAAYNAGETRIASNLEKQRASTYFDLNLNAETSRYLFRILALKEILQHPAKYGFEIDRNEYYEPLPEYYIVEVDETIDNLGDFAEKYDISYRRLKVYNPWMLTHKLPDESGKLYEIKIPEQN